MYSHSQLYPLIGKIINILKGLYTKLGTHEGQEIAEMLFIMTEKHNR